MDETTFVEQLRSLSRIENADVIREELQNVRSEDLAEAFQRLETDEALTILSQLDAMMAAEVLVDLPTETARRLVQELPDTVLAHYVDILPMDDALELREEIDDDRFDALLEVIPFEDAQEIRRLLSYPEDSAGRLMTEAFFEVSPDLTVAEILRDIRHAGEEKYETINDLYVLDEGRHLLGVFSLRKVLRASPDTTARELMRTDVISARASDDAEDAARQMARYGFYSLPVIDDRGRMVGIFTGDDAQEILREAETEDVLKLGAVSGDVEAYLSLNVWQLFKRRFWWLLFLFVAESFTGSVMRNYVHAQGEAQTGELALIAQLTVFIPLLIGAGGNAGAQVTTMVTRALAVGEVKTSDAMTILRREVATSILMGLILGGIGFLRALWWWGSDFRISLVIGLALPAIIFWSSIVGSVLPLGAKRLGIDPAVMSAPFISTFVDATGLVIFFEIARHILGLTYG
ncbi:MAG: magnesium transporter [Fimbriimonadaceae bacterium]|nr:magnesium transporter [Fimbriimonadaceae bacterium]